MSMRTLRRGTIAGWVQAPATVTALSLPGSAANYASTPDSVAASVTGDIDIRVHLTPPDWTPAAWNSLVAKWAGSGPGSYWLSLTPSGLMGRYWTGSTLVSDSYGSLVSSSLVDGQPGWLRLTRTTAGAWTQQYSLNGTSWTIVNSGTMTSGSLDDTAAAVVVGNASPGGGSPSVGIIHYAEVRSGIDGTVVAKFDPSTVTILGTRNPTTLVASTGETWTVSGSAWDWVAV